MNRLQTVGIFLTLLAVAALVGSLAYGVMAGGNGADPTPNRAAVDSAAWTEPIRVEVLNGAGTAGAARRVTAFLRERGFDVVYYGNADRFDVDSTVVLDRLDRLESARQVADSLGVRRVRSEPDAELYLDVTVILGRDWN